MASPTSAPPTVDRPRINRVTVVIIVAGLALATVIYALADRPDDEADAADPLARKKYVRELAVYGGKANVLSADFMDWFGRLWQGERLAGTVAVLTLLAAGGYRVLALHPPPPNRS